MGKQHDLCFSRLKCRRRGYSVSAKVLSFLQMIIKGGDRLSDMDLLRAALGLLALLRIEGVPRPNTFSELARRFRRRDIHRLAECKMRLAVRVSGQEGLACYPGSGLHASGKWSVDRRKNL